MSYKSLYKIFYTNLKEYQDEYKRRFSNSHTVHLDFEINGEPAFFVLEPSVFSQIIDIYKTDKHIQFLSNELPRIAIEHFTTRCLVDEIILNNGIEGINSTRREIKSILLKSNGKKQKKRFNGLVQKYLMLKSGQSLSFKSCEDIRALYDDLVYEEIKADDPNNLPDGKIFRKDATDVIAETQKIIHRGMYPEEKIIEYMGKALKFLNDNDIEFLFRVAVFHYLFGFIHPFYDGNGRTSRFISSYLLSKEFEPIIAFRLSYTIKENLKDYYEAFKTCNDKRNKGDITPFVVMFIGIINKSFRQLEDALQKRYEMLNYYRHSIIYLPDSSGEKYKTLYYLLIQASLFSENGIKTQELMEIMEISRTTLANRIKVLEQKNMIIKKQEGSSCCYSLNLDAVNEILSNQANIQSGKAEY